MDSKEFLENLKTQAKIAFIPIIRAKSANFLQENIAAIKPKSILEIGTAIGYSAILMIQACPDCHITTIEKDEQRFNQALQNFEHLGVSDRIDAINDDALNVLKSLASEGRQFDFIFLDGPKGQYIKYLPYLEKLLPANGVLIADNIFLLGLVQQDGKIDHKHRTMVVNMRKFLSQIQSNPVFEVSFFDQEDGMILCKKIKNE